MEDFLSIKLETQVCSKLMKKLGTRKIPHFGRITDIKIQIRKYYDSVFVFKLYSIC